MGVTEYLSGVWRALRYAGSRGRTEGGEMPEYATRLYRTEAERYQVLRAYRGAQDLYGRLGEVAGANGYAGYKNIRNPAHALAELYAFKLTEGTWENLEAPEDLAPLVERILEDSNWRDRAEIAVRDYAATGDLFFKASNTEDRTFFQWIDPAHVTEFDEDERGHISFCRLDVPQSRRVDTGKLEDYVETEVWDRGQGYHAVYEHDGGPDTSLEDLLRNSESRRGNVTLIAYDELTEVPEGTGDYTGFDFVPIVHRKLRDTGNVRGEGAFEHALADIDETNELATKLHAMLFPDIVWYSTPAPGAAGEPLPPIEFEDEDGNPEKPESRIARLEQEKSRVVPLGNQKLIRGPGGSSLTPLIPSVKIQDHAEVLTKQVQYVEEHRLPELQYRALKDQGTLSGKAAKLYLADATDRLGGARRKYDDALVRVIQMCLTLGALAGVEGFEGVGSYEDRKFLISISEREVFPVSDLDRLEEDVKEASIRQTYQEMGLLRLRLEEEGLEEERIAEILASVQAPQSATLTDLLGARNLTQ